MSAIINIKVAPRRMLTLKEACDYVGVKQKRFVECRIAPVSMPSGDQLYDMRDLDDWIDRRKVGGAESDEDILGKLA